MTTLPRMDLKSVIETEHGREQYIERMSNKVQNIMIKMEDELEERK